jgi:hypothetical protein
MKSRSSWPRYSSGEPEHLAGAFHKVEIEKWWSIIKASNIKDE